jgi:hypothetical protein
MTSKKIFIISGIIPATFTVYLCVVGLFLFGLEIRNWDWPSLLVAIICLLGIIGYVGLWKCLLAKPKDNQRINSVLLFGGILSIGLTLVMKSMGQLPLRIFNFPQDIGRLISIIWPGIVACYIVVKGKYK